MRNSFKTWIVGLLLPGLTGCLTQRLWQGVETGPVGFERVAGITPAGPTGRRWLVAEYGAGEDKRVVRVPLAADGRPLAPFDWHGSTDERTASTVPAGQRRQVDRTAAPQRAGSALDRLVVQSGPVNVVDNGAVVLAAYHVKPNGALEWASIPRRPTTLPADVHVVVLPTGRALRDRQSRQMKTVALTPLAVAGDTAIVVGVGALVAGLVYLTVWLDRHDDDCGCDDDTVFVQSHHHH